MILHDVDNNEIKIKSQIIDIIDWRTTTEKFIKSVGRILNSTVILADGQIYSIRETKEEIESMKKEL